MIESWKQSGLVAIVVIAAIVMGGGLQMWSLHQHPALVAQTIKVLEERPIDPGITTTFPTTLEALAYASSKAGFRVGPPAYVPPGYLLASIFIPFSQPQPADVQSGRAVPHFALLEFQKGLARFGLLEANSPYSLGGYLGQIIASPAIDSQIFIDATSVAVQYTLVTPARQVALVTRGADRLTDTEAVRVLTSVP